MSERTQDYAADKIAKQENHIHALRCDAATMEAAIGALPYRGKTVAYWFSVANAKMKEPQE